MTDCIFCKVIKKEIPCYKIYEDSNIIAFLDIKPINPGHVLIVPKEHVETILDASEATLKELLIITKKLLPLIEKATKAEGFTITINHGEKAGQVVPHLHLHLIPRFENDGRKLWKGKDYKENEDKEIEDKITSLIS